LVGVSPAHHSNPYGRKKWLLRYLVVVAHLTEFKRIPGYNGGRGLNLLHYGQSEDFTLGARDGQKMVVVV